LTANGPKVVLLHGMLGIPRFFWREYFHNVRPMLEQMGLQVIVPRLPWGGTIKARADSLFEQLKNEAGPLHLIAHSMSGLDARSCIMHMNSHANIASLTTLSTPHHGSAAADYVLSGFSLFRLLSSMADLTPKAIRIFNGQTPNHPNVIYRSYSAARPVAEQPCFVRRYGRTIQAAEGDNDSQVSVSSAQWGEHVRTLYADHFEIIGLNLWMNPFRKRQRFNHIPLYREIAEWILRFEQEKEGGE